jgi:hypothetical protein
LTCIKIDRSGDGCEVLAYSQTRATNGASSASSTARAPEDVGRVSEGYRGDGADHTRETGRHNPAIGGGVDRSVDRSDELDRALEAAAAAGRFDVVSQLAKELEARRLAREPNIVAIAPARRR